MENYYFNTSPKTEDISYLIIFLNFDKDKKLPF